MCKRNEVRHEVRHPAEKLAHRGERDIAGARVLGGGLEERRESCAGRLRHGGDAVAGDTQLRAACDEDGAELEHPQ